MKTSPRRQGRNQLRIIGGKWRGRKLDFPSVAGLRPTGDRIRETLFNWLAPYMAGAHCLDLFAGSGALGLEAASRGAAHITMLDTDSRVVNQLQAHCERLAADNVTVLQSDALKWLEGKAGNDRFDIAFLDPPFQANILEPLVAAFNHSGHLRNGGLIYLETGLDQSFSAPANWQVLKHKRAGQVEFALYEYRDPAQPD